MLHCNDSIPRLFQDQIILPVLLFAVIFSATPARADDQFTLLMGKESLDHYSSPQSTDTWQIEYLHDWNQTFSYSLDHVNLGEFNQGISRHPDYDGGNLWWHVDFLDHHLRLSAGVGLLFYYDTVGSSYGQGSTNTHGFGISYTMAATWHTDGPWLFQARASYVDAGGFDTQSVMLGVGYQLDFKGTADAGNHDDDFAAVFDQNKNEITLYGGQGVINQPYNVKTQSVALEYRRDISAYLQWSIAYLDEGDSALADRRGIIGELWLSKSFFDKRLSLSAGVGPYAARDRKQNPFVTTMRSFAAAYQVTPSVGARATWERVITNYNRDSDVFLIGGSYRF